MNIKHERGLTLIEIMISIVVVSSAFAGLAMAFSSGLMAIKTTRETSVAVQAAQREIETLRNTPFDGIETHSFDVPELTSGTGTAVVQPQDADMKKVSIEVAWTSGPSKSMIKEFVTYVTRNGINRQ